MTKDAYTFRYRVRNWSHYNQALIARGGITFWIDEAALTTWRNTQASHCPGGYCQLNVLRPKWDALAERWHRLLRAYRFLPNLERLST